MNLEQEGDRTEDREAGKATDMQAVMFLIGHIENPCEAEVAPGEMRNIRHVYLNDAREFLPRLTNPDAKKMLEETINKYEERGKDE